MKKRLIGLMAAVVICLFAGAAIALAQDATTVNVFGVEVDLTQVDALVAILSGAVVTLITQFVKTKVKFFSEGPGAFLLTVIVCAASTGIYFLIINPMSPWNWITYLIYSGVVLGESTGYFHLYKKITKTPSTN